MGIPRWLKMYKFFLFGLKCQNVKFAIPSSFNALQCSNIDPHIVTFVLVIFGDELL